MRSLTACFRVVEPLSEPKQHRLSLQSPERGPGDYADSILVNKKHDFPQKSVDASDSLGDNSNAVFGLDSVASPPYTSDSSTESSLRCNKQNTVTQSLNFPPTSDFLVSELQPQISPLGPTSHSITTLEEHITATDISGCGLLKPPADNIYPVCTGPIMRFRRKPKRGSSEPQVLSSCQRPHLQHMFHLHHTPLRIASGPLMAAAYNGTKSSEARSPCQEHPESWLGRYLSSGVLSPGYHSHAGLSPGHLSQAGHGISKPLGEIFLKTAEGSKHDGAYGSFHQFSLPGASDASSFEQSPEEEDSSARVSARKDPTSATEFENIVMRIRPALVDAQKLSRPAAMFD
ncbi:hypothetical protein CEUSTIGMA_g13949.t1 [Chlamydomonas eustigma]|uniref:Uncharacterized protein n=1 Tax=Chlamydomonas eustigma TaxID=1157962 RepID=A0A250XUE7_9CHLO|nr:hypothetical protein CEUSTIGMA_g13949.t1 [Chlamydomonas eustigma]|eukprot:GAX86542.1 hypothetical protein CEUSTIGMA_g13949.t1 [Chlamydomonas eustigma]